MNTSFYKHGRVAISPTRLKTFKECPAKFYFEYIIKSLKLPVAPFVFGPGNTIHKLADNYVTFKYYEKPISQEEEEKSINNLLKENKLDNTYYQRVYTEYHNIITFLEKFTKDPNVALIKSEKKIDTEYHDKYYFFGYIDLRVYYKDGSLKIIDYKTSKEEGNHDIQLGVYAYAVAKAEKIPINKISCGVYYTQFNEYQEVSYDKDKLKEIMMQVEIMLRESEQATTFKKQKNQYCPFCSHRDTCSAIKEEFVNSK
jgi:RecB family exonuclease